MSRLDLNYRPTVKTPDQSRFLGEEVYGSCLGVSRIGSSTDVRSQGRLLITDSLPDCL